MKATELLDHIRNNLAAGKPAAHNLVLASKSEPAESYKINFDHPELYRVRQYPEIIRQTDDIMYSPGVPGQPPVPFGIDYQKLNQLIYERTSTPYRAFHSETDLRDYVIEQLNKYLKSDLFIHPYVQAIKAGTVKL